MADKFSGDQPPQSIDTRVARNLATTTKTVPQTAGITPRWLLQLLPWVNVEAGTYRVNRVKVVHKEAQKVSLKFQDGRVSAEELRAIPLLRSLEGSVLAALARRLKLEEYGLGEILVWEGRPVDRFYIIARGKVEVLTTGDHGERLRVGTLTTGDHFSEFELYRDLPSEVTVKTATAAQFLTLAKGDFEELLGQAGIQAALDADVEAYLKSRESTYTYGERKIDLKAGHTGTPTLPSSFVDYELEPREYPLTVAQTILQVHTRVTDLYNNPIIQLREQLRLTIEGLKEQQEWEIINNPDFGLLHAASPATRIQPRYGPPTPDDLDELLSKVWKQPAFFLAHPRAIAAFGRECTRRGVPPPTTQVFGSPFLTWRGVPIVPSDKLGVQDRSRNTRGQGPGTTNILLIRVGEKEQGVVGLHQSGIPGEQLPGLAVRFMGINDKAIASYLLNLYFSCAVLTDDAVGVLENVEVGFHHDYEHAQQFARQYGPQSDAWGNIYNYSI